MHDHVDAWPFKEPVDSRDVPDYYEIIKDPVGKNSQLSKFVSWIFAAFFGSLVVVLLCDRSICNF